MSEPTNIPPDFPLEEARAKRVSVRKALAGLYMLNGEGSAYRCMLKAGYSRATARRLNGLSAKDCIEEASKLDSTVGPAKLLQAARSRAMLAIESMDPRTVRLSDAMKMLDVSEKYYGNHEVSPSDSGLKLAERLAGIAALLAVARERGLPVPQALHANDSEALTVQAVVNKELASAESDNI